MKAVWAKESLKKLIEIEQFITRDNPDRARGSLTDPLIVLRTLIKKEMYRNFQ